MNSIDEERAKLRDVGRWMIVASLILLAIFSSSAMGVIVSSGNSQGFVSTAVFSGLVVLGLHIIRRLYIARKIEVEEVVY
jgi:hypothetical protein